MRLYYIHVYDNETPNAYRLYYINSISEKDLLPEGVERISKPDALKLARQEAFRRKYNRPNSGLADDTVYPAAYDRDRSEICKDPRYYLNNRIWYAVE
jgi:hypothetical protein